MLEHHLHAADASFGMLFEQKTGDVIVRVQPDYLHDESSPKDDRYIWAYTVEIENTGTSSLKVVERVWNIADSRGQVQCVRGNGVVGEQPVLQPGEVFRYTSGAPLSAPAGMMHGTYKMTDEDGESFDVFIPVFALDSPAQAEFPN